MSQFDLSDWQLRELKSEPITEKELDTMYTFTKSYEALFSKRSTQIKARSIDVKTLSEADYKALILDHYSFLKRPIFITDDRIFIGNEKKNLEALDNYFK